MGGTGVRSSCFIIGGSIQCYIGYLVQCAGMMCRAKSCALTAHALAADAVVELLVRALREEWLTYRCLHVRLQNLCA